LILSYLLIDSVNSSGRDSHKKHGPHKDGHRDDHKYSHKLFNKPLEKQNPSANKPPKTDTGGPTFKYPYAFTRTNRYPGGWARRITTTDLAIATKLSANQNRLKQNSPRELHWHDSAQLSYVLSGQVRVTAVDPDGRGFVGDARKGDLYYIPAGWGHSVQGLGCDGALVLVVFNSGNPSTFNLDDYLRRIPLKVLAKNFETTKCTFDKLPKKDLYIYKGKHPDHLKEEKHYVAKVTGEIQPSLIYHKKESPPNITRSFGSVRIVDKRNFPGTPFSVLIVKLEKGALRELHWNLVGDGLIYCVKGKGRIGKFFGNGQARTQDVREGDIAYIQQYRAYYVENTGDCELKFIEVFPNTNFADISLGQWLAHTPPKIVNGNLRTGKKFIRHIKKEEQYIVKGCR